MKAQTVKEHLDCLKLIQEKNLLSDVTRCCHNTGVLLECLKALPDNTKLGQCKKNVQFAALSSIEYLQYILKLVKLVTDIGSINNLFSLVNGENLLEYEPEDIARILNDEYIEKEYILIYIKLFNKEELSDAEKKLFCTSLFQLRLNRFPMTDDWLIENRRVLLEPMIANSMLKLEASYERVVNELTHNMEFRKVLRFIEDNRARSTYLDDEHVNELLKSCAEIGELLPVVLGYFTESYRKNFIHLWTESHALLYDLKHFVKNKEKGQTESWDNVVISKAAYVAFCYNEYFPIVLVDAKEPLIIYAVANGKHAFLKLVRENIEVIQNTPTTSLLFDRKFYSQCVNLNTANVKDLLNIASIEAHKVQCRFALVNKERTFAEVILLHNLPEYYIRFYDSLPIERIDEKIIVMKELKKHMCLPNVKDYKSLGKHLAKKKVSQWMQLEFACIKDSTFTTAVKLLIEYDTLKHLIPEMQTDAEACYIIANMKSLNLESMETVKSSLLAANSRWSELCDKFEISNTFIQQYKENILNFILSGGVDIVLDYYEGMQDKYRDIRLLLIAELTGKFKQLKYHEDDLQKEIGHEVQDYALNEWKNCNRIEDNSIAVWEEDGFLPTMKLGVMPINTCLAYTTGMYKSCLLANFDSNKKVIYLSINGKVVLRALLRLTKGSWNKCDVDGPSIHFADVTNETKNFINNREHLVLFLEKAYTCGLTQQYKDKAYELLLKLVSNKAKEMGVLCTLSLDYHNNVNSEWVSQNYYMYISKSKAGSQYLDSLGGENGVSLEGRYRKIGLLSNSKFKEI